MAPERNNPFDSENNITSGHPFNLQTQNLSGHILISWDYAYDNPVVDSYLLYRLNGSALDTLYTGLETTFSDTTVQWDSTYSYYVTGMINNKETSPPKIDDLKEVIRRIYVGEDSDYTTIGEAFNSLKDGDVIYVKDGLYKENIDFKGKAITLKSENGPNNCIIDGKDNDVVVTMNSGENEKSILYGFTIKNGLNHQGGGLHINDSSPVIRKCIIEYNTAGGYGGGIYLCNSFALIDSCIIRNNDAGEGGGIYITYEQSAPIFLNCNFTENTSILDGGGAFLRTSDVTFTHCLFNNNKAGDDGGSIFLTNANLYVTYGSFLSNESIDEGGAIYFDSGGETSTITNTIFSDNYGKNGGGAVFSKSSSPTISYSTFCNNKVDKEEDSNGSAIFCEYNSEMTIINSILWNNTGNTDPEIYIEPYGYGLDPSIDTLFTINFSDIKGGYIGVGNLNINPLFGDANNGNFHLQENSPCIGTTSTLDPNDQMGAYGGENGDWR